MEVSSWENHRTMCIYIYTSYTYAKVCILAGNKSIYVYIWYHVVYLNVIHTHIYIIYNYIIISYNHMQLYWAKTCLDLFILDFLAVREMKLLRVASQHFQHSRRKNHPGSVKLRILDGMTFLVLDMYGPYMDMSRCIWLVFPWHAEKWRSK
jgi:hypothetical protein